MMYHQPTKGRLKMPTTWSAGEHDCRVFIDDGIGRVQCKCGWFETLTKDELWDPSEKWRLIASAHVEAAA